MAQGNSPLALGNVVGSVISNILAAFSLGLLVQTGLVTFDRSSKIYVTLLTILTIPVVVLAYFRIQGVVVGGILIAIFGLYILSIGVAIYRGIVAAPVADDSSDDESVDSSDSEPPLNATARDTVDETTALIPSAPHARTLGRHITQLIIGFFALSLSGYTLSHSATSIAAELNISSTVYGITILSFATTLPEKFIAVVGASRGHDGIVVANTAGSNIFLLTLCLGVVYVSGDEVGEIGGFEMAVALASTVLFAMVVFLGGRRWMGGVLLLGYVAFIVQEFTVFRADHSV